MKDIPCVDSCLLRLGFLSLMYNASQQTAVHTGYVLHAKDLHIIGLNSNRTIGLNLNVTILNSLQLKY